MSDESIIPVAQRRALVAALLAGVAIGHWTTPASATETATFRTVDIAVICTTHAQHGMRQIQVAGAPRVVTPNVDWPARGSVLTGFSILGMESLVGAEARGDAGNRPTGGVFVHRRRCSTTQARIPLSSRGLLGPPTLHQRGYECAAPRRVIVRLRANLKTPGAWIVGGQGGELRMISRDVLSAAIAVRTWPGRKPLGYVTFDRMEQMRLWAAYGCD